MHNDNRNSHANNALEKIMLRQIRSSQKCGEKANKVVQEGCSSFIFTETFSVLRNNLP